jgi:hypothetical protein
MKVLMRVINLIAITTILTVVPHQSVADSSVTPSIFSRTNAANNFSTCTQYFKKYGTSGCSSDGWIFVNGATFYCDPQYSHDGNGCVAQLGGTGGDNHELIETAKLYPITPGNTYTFSFYMKVDRLPQGIPQVSGQFYYSDSETRVPNSDPYFQKQSVTTTDQWQEVTFIFKAPNLSAFVRPTIAMIGQTKNPTGDSTFSISDAFLAQNIVINELPTNKITFNGSRVHVDSLGNFSVYQGGKFLPFFPVCVMADFDRPGNNTSSDWWKNYSKQGFNCNTRAGSPQSVLRGKQNNLFSGYQIAQYINPSSSSYADADDLAYNINGVGNSNSLASLGVLDSLLFYYWDNENDELYEWDTPSNIAQTINTNDLELNDSGRYTRAHPIYMLQGKVGLVRKYNATGVVSGTAPSALTDIVGTYILNTDGGLTSNGGYTQALGHVLLNNTQGQNQPVSIAQFNAPLYSGMNFRAAVYTAIANGARGISFWKDCADDTSCNKYGINPIDQNAWWPILPSLSATIQSQLSIIRTSLSTDWHLTKTSNNDNVQAGTRTYQGKGYVIAGNENSAPANPAFTISGLNYTPTAVINAFTKDSIASISSSSFTLPIDANDGGFYILGDNFPDSLALNLQFNGDLNDTSTANNSNGALVGGSASISNNMLVLSGGYAQTPFQQSGTVSASPSLEMNNNLTIVARVNISTSQIGYASIVTKGANTSHIAGYAFFYDSSNNQLDFWYGSGTDTVSDRNTLHAQVPPLVGAWHTVAVTATLSGSVTFYVDGAAYVGVGTVHAETPNTVVNSLQPVQIGAWSYGSYLQGAIDNVRIYKSALTAQEIAALTQNVLQLGVQSSPGNSRFDLSLFGNDITSTSYTWNPTAPTSTANAMIGYQPAASSAPIFISNASGTPQGLELNSDTNISISARVRILNSNSTGHAAIVSKGAGDNQTPGYVLTYNTDNNKLGFWLCCAQGQRGYFNSVPIILNDGASHDIVVTFNRGLTNINFYVDGALVNPGDISVPSSFSGTDFSNIGVQLQIGSWGYGNYLNGEISNIFIDRRVISLSEIQQRHNLLSAPSSP